MTKIADEIKLQVVADYEAGLLRKEIAEKNGIGTSSVGFILQEFGVNNRKGKRGVKTCPRCHKKVELKGAKFCPWCGNDIRSEEELLAVKLEKILDHYHAFPTAEADEITQTIIAAAKKLREI